MRDKEPHVGEHPPQTAQQVPLVLTGMNSRAPLTADFMDIRQGRGVRTAVECFDELTYKRGLVSGAA